MLRRAILFVFVPFVLQAQESEWQYHESGPASFALTTMLAGAGSAVGTFGMIALMNMDCHGGTCSTLDKVGAIVSLSAPFVGAATGAVIGGALTGRKQHFGRSMLASLGGMAVGGIAAAAVYGIAGRRRPIPAVPMAAFFIPVGAVTAWLGR